MGSAADALREDDRALLERVAGRIVELRLEVPAILTLESARPLSMIAGQTMLFFEPLVLALLRFGDYRRFAKLVENRDALEWLTHRIERLADERREAGKHRGSGGAGRGDSGPPT
jgi:hypothetical protein